MRTRELIEENAPYHSPDKTGVSGSSPEWPTKTVILEELPLRKLIIALLGDDWRRRLENRSKTNSQVFTEYFDLIASSKSAKWDYETRRLLNQFWQFIGEFPPSIELFTRFFQRFSNLAPSTRARYYFVFSAFFKWYSGQNRGKSKKYGWPSRLRSTRINRSTLNCQ